MVLKLVWLPVCLWCTNSALSIFTLVVPCRFDLCPLPACCINKEFIKTYSVLIRVNIGICNLPISSWLVSIYLLGISPLFMMAFVFTIVIIISPLLFLSPTHILLSLLPSLLLFLFFSFRLTHSLTLMHASLLENGCTSLPGESFTHPSAWFSHDLLSKNI